MHHQRPFQMWSFLDAHPLTQGERHQGPAGLSEGLRSICCLSVYILICLIIILIWRLWSDPELFFNTVQLSNLVQDSSSLTSTTLLEGRVAINSPEHNLFSLQHSHLTSAALFLLRKAHPIPLLTDREEQGSKEPQRPYLLQCRGEEPCQTPLPSTSSRCWKSCWPSCCSVTLCWSGHCCSLAGQHTSWCLNESYSSAPATTG